MPLRQDLIAYQGETWSFVYTKRDSSGAAVSLTGYTARMSIKDAYNGALEAYFSTGSDADGGTITLGGAAGTVTLSMTAAQSAALAGELNALSSVLLRGERDTTKPSATYLYDLELISGAGVVTRELEGRFVVRREVTA